MPAAAPAAVPNPAISSPCQNPIRRRSADVPPTAESVASSGRRSKRARPSATPLAPSTSTATAASSGTSQVSAESDPVSIQPERV